VGRCKEEMRVSSGVGDGNVVRAAVGLGVVTGQLAALGRAVAKADYVAWRGFRSCGWEAALHACRG